MEDESKCKILFASDNYSPICLAVLEKLAEVSKGSSRAYGGDDYTAQAKAAIEAFFGRECRVFFVFNGTAANALALSSLCASYHGIITHTLSHIQVDESGAPEYFSGGAKVYCCGDKRKKMQVGDMATVINELHGVHSSKPRCVTITQCTETGMVYEPSEVKALVEEARSYGLKVHMDGARLFNAIARLKVSAAEITWKAGIDVLSFGGTKNGSMLAEAVVFFDTELADEFEWRQKQSGQLYSKGCYQGASWLGLLEENLWLENATNANDMASYLEAGLKAIEGVKLLYPVDANIVFVNMPKKLADKLLEDGWVFYDFPKIGGWRFVCSWNTQKVDIDRLLQAIRKYA